MKRLTTLIFQYYRLLLYSNMMFSGLLICLSLKFFSIQAVFFAKVMGFIAAVLHHYYMQGNSYFYFRNAGLSIRQLYFYTFTVDLMIFIMLFIAFTYLHHAPAYLKS